MTQLSWLDPEDPRAPTQAEWDRMTPEQRDAVVRSLPADMPPDRFIGMIAELVEARDAALHRAEEEARRAEEEARRASVLESDVAALRAELERLRRER